MIKALIVPFLCASCVLGASGCCCGLPGGVVIGHDAGYEPPTSDAGRRPPTPRDAGAPRDAGTLVPTCMQTGQAAGRCIDGTFCTDLSCTGEVTHADGAPYTLSNLGYTCRAPDPANPDAYVSIDCDVPLPFAPGGLCAGGCAPTTSVRDETCPPCATCSASLGDGRGLTSTPLTVRALASPTSDAQPGICRANCVFEPTTSGCQAGYTCSVAENVCLEACVSDALCNVRWKLTSRHDGLAAVVDGSASCNLDTGRCQWTPPAGASFGSPCHSDTDCPADVGVCLGGWCTTYQCNATDRIGNPLYPCPSSHVCVGFGGNMGAFCLALCNSADDCLPGLACTPQAGLPGGTTGLCYPGCESDDACRSTEACNLGALSVDLPGAPPSAGLRGACEPRCTPGGTDCPNRRALRPGHGANLRLLPSAPAALPDRPRVRRRLRLRSARRRRRAGSA